MTGGEATAGDPTVSEQTSAFGETDADLLQGLSALADLLTNASDTLNQCLLTLENKLNAAAIAREEWIPIQSAGSGIDRLLTEDACPASQERIFAGVAVTILKMSSAPPPQPTLKRSEWRYELGYSVAGDEWALMIRTASSDALKSDAASPEFTDVMRLRDAPLEIRLKAIRDIPALMQLFAETEPVPPDPPSEAALEDEPQLSVDEVMEQLELSLILDPETEGDQVEAASSAETKTEGEQQEEVSELEQTS